MLGLFVAGLVVCVGGLLGVGFGIPVKEFSFGNTLIVTGVLGVCTGVILIALSLLLRELKKISLALQSANREAADRGRPVSFDDESSAFAAPRMTPASPLAASGDKKQVSQNSTAPAFENPVPWRDELPARDRTRLQDQDPPEGPTALSQQAKKRRDLLFMSTRRDRMQLSDQLPVAIETDEAEGAPAATLPGAAREDAATRESAWTPPADEPRSDGLRRRARQSVRAEFDEGRTRSAGPPPIRRPVELPAVTILKSGVVDGMAYSLYSDGSIEAQMPEGMIRFGSIEELRNHLDQRS